MVSPQTPVTQEKPSYYWSNGKLYVQQPIWNDYTNTWGKGQAKEVGYRNADGTVYFSTLPSPDAVKAAGLSDQTFYVNGTRYRNINDAVTAVDETGRPFGEGLAQEYQKSFDEAKAQNLKRYGEVKGGYETMYGETKQALQGLGLAERAGISEGYRKGEAASRQELTSRGLGASTVMSNVSATRARKEAIDQNALQERLVQQRLGYLNPIRQAQLQFVERRQDTYPDYDLLARLAQMQGKTGGAFGG